MPRVATRDLEAKIGRVYARVSKHQARVARGQRFHQLTDEQAQWDAAGIDREGLDCLVHEYSGPSGLGWELEVRVSGRDGDYRRTYSDGPEAVPGAGWELVGEGA